MWTLKPIKLFQPYNLKHLVNNHIQLASIYVTKRTLESKVCSVETSHMQSGSHCLKQQLWKNIKCKNTLHAWESQKSLLVTKDNNCCYICGASLHLTHHFSSHCCLLTCLTIIQTFTVSWFRTIPIIWFNNTFSFNHIVSKVSIYHSTSFLLSNRFILKWGQNWKYLKRKQNKRSAKHRGEPWSSSFPPWLHL